VDHSWERKPEGPEAVEEEEAVAYGGQDVHLDSGGPAIGEPAESDSGRGACGTARGRFGS
jgi:hypothetical protein